MPKSLYSFFSVLKQCAQVETTFLTLCSLNVSTFCAARPWKTNSLPARRAGSPVQVSPLPSTPKRDAGHVEQLGDRAGRLLGAVLVGAGAADPEQPVDRRRGTRGPSPTTLTSNGRSLAQSMPRGGGHVPRVALVLQALEQLVELGREVRLDQHLVAAHVDDVVDVLDVDRALLDAGAARGAGPQHVLVDDGAAVGSDRRPRCADQRPLGLGLARRRAAPSRFVTRRPGGTAPWRTRGRAGP